MLGVVAGTGRDTVATGSFGRADPEVGRERWKEYLRLDKREELDTSLARIYRAIQSYIELYNREYKNV